MRIGIERVSWRQSYVNFRTLKRVPFDPTWHVMQGHGSL